MLQFLWYARQFCYHLLVLFLGNGFLLGGEAEGKHGKHGDLPREGFGRGYTNLWPHVDVDTCVGLTRNAGSNGVADAKDKGSCLAGKFDGG